MDVDDLLMEILLRLPAKSLTRFKSVCKKWLSLISSDYFCHQHTLRGPKLQSSLILYSHGQLFYFNPTINGQKTIIPYSLSVPNHHILQACNGLWLLAPDRIPTSKRLKRRGKRSYYVYNPTTKRSRKISLTSSYKYPCLATVNLAFYPSKSPYYKIVCIRYTADGYYDIERTYQIEVYDSESHSWKVVLEAFIYPRISSGVHCNNGIYWRSSVYNGDYNCFDIAKNDLKTLSSPQFPDSGQSYFFPYLYLQESGGHLYHFRLLFKKLEEKEGESSVAVWELGGGENSQWLLKHHHVFDSKGIDRRINGLKFMRGGDGDGDGEGDWTMCSLLTYGAWEDEGLQLS